MTCREVKTYEWRCDETGCPVRAITHDSHDLPEGWTRRERVDHDCGLTGYTRREMESRCSLHSPTFAPPAQDANE